MANLSIKNYFKPTPKSIQKLLLGVKSVLGVVSGAVYMENKPSIAFWILILGAALDEIAKLLTDTEQ